MVLLYKILSQKMPGKNSNFNASDFLDGSYQKQKHRKTQISYEKVIDYFSMDKDNSIVFVISKIF